MGVGDEVPAAIAQLGVKVEMLDAGGPGVGRPVAVPHHRHRRSRLRTAQRSARQQQPAARLRPERRHAHRSVQQVRVQRGAVRAVPGQGQQRPRHRRTRAGRRARAAAIPVFNDPNEITDEAWKRLGAGARSVFPGRARPAIPRPRGARGSVSVQQGREAGRAGRGAVRQRDVGCTSAWACGASCRPASTAPISCWRT